MATVAVRKQVRTFGPQSAGTLTTPREFDRAEFVEGYRYELIHGVLVVSPPPLLNERDPNQALGHWLLSHQQTHPQGSALDYTIHEQTVRTKNNRRRADRVIWAGLGRLPRRNETPTIIAEFVSAGKRDRQRDYEEKRDEYMAIRVKEYWVIDRFQRTLTVFSLHKGRTKKRVFSEQQVYTTDLLPGFELPVAQLVELANRWPEEETERPEL
jgi:Uma2 family endonuclease